MNNNISSLKSRSFSMRLFMGALFLLGSSCHQFAQAQGYASKPIHIVSPFPAAGPSDTAARLLAPKLIEALGQPIVLENKPGASGTVGSLSVVKATPDGYTLLLGATTSHIAPYLLRTQTYDPMLDLQPITNIGSMPFYLMVHSSVGAKTLGEFIAAAKNQPGKFTYSSPGNGSLAHLCMELLKAQANINLLHVPYKGSAQAVQDVIAGHVHATCNVTPTKSDQIKVLAVTSTKRSIAMPDVPTSSQAGLLGFELSLWVGLFGPQKLPATISERLSREVNRILSEQDMQEKLRTVNIEFIPNTPEQFTNFLATDTPRWGKLIRDIGVKVDKFLPKEFYMSNFLQINGRRIHYVETGPKNAPAVVLLHGQSGFWYDWSEVAPGLAKNYRVVAIDHPGFGDSDWDPSYKTYLVEGFAKEMEEVTKQLSLDRFVLVGHSFGGRIGLAYACSHPKQLRAVVLADSSPDVDPAGSLEARKYLASIPAEFETFEQAMEFFHKHYPNFTSNSLRERLLNYLTQLPSGSYRVKRDPAIGAKYSLILQGKAQAPEPDWGSLRNLTCPVLLLRGTNSELVTIGIENQMRQVNPNMETIEITNAGHLVATEQPEQVLKALLNYLRRLPA